MYRHIVLTKFNDPDIAAPEASRRLLALQARIPEIAAMETHFDIEHTARSYDMVLLTAFRSREDYLVYADHPDHCLVKAYIGEHACGSVIIDYED